MNTIKQIEKIPMGDDDIREVLPDAKIITYPQLKKYKSITQLLKKPKDYVFILYLDSPNSGHWVGLLRYDDKIEVFDSYGKKIDNPLKWTSLEEELSLGIDDKYLTNLLDNSSLPVFYNNVDYQSQSSTIQTCGRHALNRILKMLKNNMNGNDYFKYMKKLKGGRKMTYDEIVSDEIRN